MCLGGEVAEATGGGQQPGEFQHLVAEKRFLRYDDMLPAVEVAAAHPDGDGRRMGTGVV